MINLLKANFYRLRKSKIFKLLLLGMIFIVTGLSVLSFLDEAFFLMIGVTYDGGERHGFYIGHINHLSSYIEVLRSSLGFIFFACISMLFLIGDIVISPFKNGTIKNSLSYGHSRIEIYISQLITNIVGTTIIVLVTIIVAMSIPILLFKINYSITWDEINFILKIIFTLLCVISSMVSIYQLISAIFKSKAIITTLGTLFMALGTGILYEFISSQVKMFIPSYMILNICGNPSGINKILPFVITSSIIIICTSMVGCMHYQKQEIK